ncbi:hypothetical protein [Actinoplanes sp. L3-i22]|uniref:hypothetical protein n=1 Tax=Actinoplanes sp. L3-i22 TaxID=2836373 RepID=UPI001C757710|nr:hypothetical protein [Actinoplanes sp. L3-i22]BCY10656.1 hypothetical protein L3i22_057440 [Actinoplanes sp. L3-i22]
MRWGRRSRDEDANHARRSQAALLEEQSLELFRQGRVAEAVPLQEQAVELVDAVIASQGEITVDDLVMLGALNYGLGSSLQAVSRPDDALAALDAAEEAYGAALDSGRADAAQWITDVRVRRARAFHGQGRVADAILAMDRVVRAVVAEGPAGDAFEHELGLCRLLYTNALLMADYGDPDLILGSADQVVRLMLARQLKINTLEGDNDYYVDVLRCAATIAMREHARQGRTEIAEAAGGVAVGTWAEIDASEIPSLIGETMALPPMYRVSIVRAAAYYGKLTGELGKADLARRYRDVAREVDAGLAAHAEQEWAAPATVRMTLGVALHQARSMLRDGEVPDEVLALGGADNARSLVTVGQRGPESDWAESAWRLTRIVPAVLNNPHVAARIGLEAHLLYAASLAATEDRSAWHGSHAYRWRIVLECLVNLFEPAGDEVMVADLRRWLAVTGEVVNEYHDPYHGRSPLGWAKAREE